MKILTFFAHPDDETLAAGATLNKLSKDNEIYTAIPATGVYARNKCKDELEQLRLNCESAISVLGINPNHIYFGDFSDNEMDKHTRLQLIKWLENIINDVKPDIIFTHHRYCTNIDHQYCHEAVIIATRPSLDGHIKIISGEVPSSTGYLKPVQFEPNLYIEVSQDNINKKIQAMETYIGEARSDPHPRSREVLQALAKVRGSESGFYFAEAFIINKEFL